MSDPTAVRIEPWGAGDLPKFEYPPGHPIQCNVWQLDLFPESNEAESI